MEAWKLHGEGVWVRLLSLPLQTWKKQWQEQMVDMHLNKTFCVSHGEFSSGLCIHA